MLTANELVMMRDEMATKVTKQSDELITLLQKRDVLLLEADAKNKFIVAFLRVQGSKHALQQSGGGGGGISTVGGDEGRPSSRNRSRSMLSLSKSFSQTIAWAKAKRNQEEDKTSSDMVRTKTLILLPSKKEGLFCQRMWFLLYISFCSLVIIEISTFSDFHYMQ